MSATTVFMGDIADRHGAVKFIEWCEEHIGLGWHPDTDFTEYVDRDSGQPSFSRSDARHLNRLLEQCFDVLGDELYDIGAELMHRKWDPVMSAS